MATGRLVKTPLSAFGPTIAPDHIRRCTGLIDEDEF
jgi:hypothetical protein